MSGTPTIEAKHLDTACLAYLNSHDNVLKSDAAEIKSNLLTYVARNKTPISLETIKTLSRTIPCEIRYYGLLFEYKDEYDGIFRCAITSDTTLEEVLYSIQEYYISNETKRVASIKPRGRIGFGINGNYHAGATDYMRGSEIWKTDYAELERLSTTVSETVSIAISSDQLCAADALPCVDRVATRASIALLVSGKAKVENPGH
ncbi:MAG: hypothetical protein FWD33_01285 [Alphaproteobacteria bacterium]|nr:hypothetical protein [Alphaproteobacteria bacterium]